MSTEGTIVGAVHGSADDPQGLKQEIERTREHLGETVEALMAKVDVKARAQDEAGRLMGRLKARAIAARQQAGIAKITPEPVRQAAGSAAATARARRTPLLAGIGAIAAGIAGWLLFQRLRRRG